MRSRRGLWSNMTFLYCVVYFRKPWPVTFFHYRHSQPGNNHIYIFYVFFRWRQGKLESIELKLKYIYGINELNIHCTNVLWSQNKNYNPVIIVSTILLPKPFYFIEFHFIVMLHLLHGKIKYIKYIKTIILLLKYHSIFLKLKRRMIYKIK